MQSKFHNTALYRLQPLLLTVIGVSACQQLFFLLLPLQLMASGHGTTPIGLAMSFYALGAILAGLFGSQVIRYIGHIRAFSFMSAIMVCVSGLHSFYDHIWLTGVLRAIAGFALITHFITLESWLNVVTDQTNRARIFSVYQICCGIGGVMAPFVFNSFTLNDPRLFSMIGIFLSASTIIMCLTMLPVPEMSTKMKPLPLKELWNISPSGTISAFCAGLITSVSVSLVAIYATERAFQGWSLSLILSSLMLGSFLTQYPTGWFADRFDKRTVASTLMAIGCIANSLIIFDFYWHLPMPVLTLIFLVSGGSAAALFPLAVTQVFDHIDTKDAVRVTGTIQVILHSGAFIGPIIAGRVMDNFGSVSLFYYISLVHFFVMIFLLCRRLFIRQERLNPTFPYQVTAQPTTLCRSGLDPRIEYSLAQVGDPTIKLLLLALAQDPKEPMALIKSVLEYKQFEPIDIATHLVLALPKQSDVLIGILVMLYPDKRMEIAQSLYELILLRKKRINALVKEGLCLEANQQEQAQIHSMIQQAIDQVDQR